MKHLLETARTKDVETAALEMKNAVASGDCDRGTVLREALAQASSQHHRAALLGELLWNGVAFSSEASKLLPRLSTALPSLLELATTDAKASGQSFSIVFALLMAGEEGTVRDVAEAVKVECSAPIADACSAMGGSGRGTILRMCERMLLVSTQVQHAPPDGDGNCHTKGGNSAWRMADHLGPEGNLALVRNVMLRWGEASIMQPSALVQFGIAASEMGYAREVDEVCSYAAQRGSSALEVWRSMLAVVLQHEAGEMKHEVFLAKAFGADATSSHILRRLVSEPPFGLSSNQLEQIGRFASRFGLLEVAKRVESGKSQCSSGDGNQQLAANDSDAGEQQGNAARVHSEVQDLIENHARTGGVPEYVLKLVNGPAKARWSSMLVPAILKPRTTVDEENRKAFVAALVKCNLVSMGAPAELRRNLTALRRREADQGDPLGRVRASAKLIASLLDDGDPVDVATESVSKLRSALAAVEAEQRDSGTDQVDKFLASAEEVLNNVAQHVASNSILARRIADAFVLSRASMEGFVKCLSNVMMERGADRGQFDRVLCASQIVAQMLRARILQDGSVVRGLWLGCQEVPWLSAEEMVERLLPVPMACDGSNGEGYGNLNPAFRPLTNSALAARCVAMGCYLRCLVETGKFIVVRCVADMRVDESEGGGVEEVPILPSASVHFVRWAKGRLEWAARVMACSGSSSTGMESAMRLLAAALDTSLGERMAQQAGEAPGGMWEVLDASCFSF